MSVRFEQDERGSAIGRFAIIGGIIGLASMFLGSAVEQMASVGSLPTVAFLTPDQYVATKGKAPNFNAIDYSATGSINGRVVLDPCTGQAKTP